MSMRTPSVASRRVVLDSFMSEPETSNSSERRISARPLIPTPPMPTKCTCRTRPRNISDLPGARRAGEIERDRARPRAPRRAGRAPRRRGPCGRGARDRARAPRSRRRAALGRRLRLRDGDGGAGALERLGRSGIWWSSAAKGNGTRIDARPTAQSSASDEAPARSITRSAARERGRHVVDEGDDVRAARESPRRVVGGAHGGVAIAAGLVHDRDVGARGDRGGDRARGTRLVERLGALAAAEHEDRDAARPRRVRRAARRRGAAARRRGARRSGGGSARPRGRRCTRARRRA